MSDLFPAARQEDDVSHSLAVVTAPVLAAVGMGAGIVLGIFTLPAGPVGVCATIALAATGASLGSWLGTKLAEVLPTVPSGTIQEGSKTVFVGAAKKPLARLEDPVECITGAMMDTAATAAMALLAAPLAIAKIVADALTQPVGGAHVHAKIVHACRTISSDGLPAARIGCKTSCGAELSEGEASVLFGGPLGSLPGYESVSETSSLDWATYVFEWVGGAAALVAALIPLGAALTGAAGAGAVILAAIQVAAGLLALFGQYHEIGGGADKKKPGFLLDDGAGALAKVSKAAAEAAKTPGPPAKKALVFARELGKELGQEGGSSVGKFFKRVDEVFAAKPPVPTF